MTSDEHRFSLYRLCECPECEGRSYVPFVIPTTKCPECRGEGRTRQCVAEADTAEAVGVALVTCASEGEWTDAAGEPCAFGLLDRTPECATCEGAGRTPIYNTPRGRGTIRCRTCKGSGVKPTGTWLILPWLPSPRNLRDAGKVLRTGRADVTAGGTRPKFPLFASGDPDNSQKAEEHFGGGSR